MEEACLISKLFVQASNIYPEKRGLYIEEEAICWDKLVHRNFSKQTVKLFISLKPYLHEPLLEKNSCTDTSGLSFQN